MGHGQYAEQRGRNFAFVQKVENLPEDWREIIASKMIPIAYVVHDKDVYTEKPELVGKHANQMVDLNEGRIGEPVPSHVHFFCYFNGKRTANGVVSMFSELNIAYAERIECKNAYLAYMLHLRQEDKHRYGYDEMVILNGLKVNFAELSDVDFGDVMKFADENGIIKYSQLMRETQYREPALFRYVQSHYAMVCAFFADEREGM